jgi:hypothetical protein
MPAASAGVLSRGRAQQRIMAKAQHFSHINASPYRKCNGPQNHTRIVSNSFTTFALDIRRAGSDRLRLVTRRMGGMVV